MLPDFSAWQFVRQSGQSVLDAEGVERVVPVDLPAIVGGDWDGETVVDGPSATGIALVAEATTDDLNLSVTQAATHASAQIHTISRRVQSDYFSVHLQYEIGADAVLPVTVFALVNGSHAFGSVRITSQGVQVAIGDAVHQHPVSGPVYDVRIRKSTYTTTWVNGDRIATMDTPALMAPVMQMNAGESQHTASAGILMRADWYKTAVPEPEIEGWPGV